MDPTTLDARLDSTSAELRAVSDLLARQCDRVVAMEELFLGTPREDVLSVLYEAERQLSLAQRAVDRATRTIQRDG